MVNFRKNLPKISPKWLYHFMLIPALYKGCCCSPLVLLVFFKNFTYTSKYDVVSLFLILICLLLKRMSTFPMLIGPFLHLCDWQFHMLCLSVNEPLVFVLLICSNSLHINPKRGYFRMFVLQIFFPAFNFFLCHFLNGKF